MVGGGSAFPESAALVGGGIAFPESAALEFSVSPNPPYSGGTTDSFHDLNSTDDLMLGVHCITRQQLSYQRDASVTEGFTVFARRTMRLRHSSRRPARGSVVPWHAVALQGAGGEEVELDEYGIIFVEPPNWDVLSS
jgi:hypothetical protein